MAATGLRIILLVLQVVGIVNYLPTAIFSILEHVREQGLRLIKAHKLRVAQPLPLPIWAEAGRNVSGIHWHPVCHMRTHP